jgi:PUA domain protein
VFYQQDRGAPLLPHLKLVRRLPDAFPSIRIHRGAVRFVLRGETLMSPSLTSPGGRLPDPADRGGAPVAEGVPSEGANEEGRWSRELEGGNLW